MASAIRKLLPVLLFFWVCTGSVRISMAQQKETPTPPSTVEIFIQTLLNEETPQELRELHAGSLLANPNAHQALIDKVLTSEGNLSAKVIVCRMIAKGNWGRSGLGLSSAAQVPKVFCEPLFAVLFQSDPELTRWAGPALVRCHNGVAKKLSEIITDPKRPAAQRIAGMSALKLIPGKEAVLNLASLLKDQEDEIRQQAAIALAEMLYFPVPLDIEEFMSFYLPEIRKTDEVTFFRWLNDRQQLRLNQANSEMIAIRRQAETLKERISKAEEEKFVLAKSPEEKLQLLAGNLKKDQEEFLREWAMNQVIQWSNTTALRSGELTSQVIELVKGYISDSNPQVRQSTAQVLGYLDPETVRLASAELLLNQLGSETDTSAKAAQLVTLGKIGYTKTLEPALKLWEKSRNVQVAASAVDVLGRIASTSDTPTVQRVIDSLAENFGRWKDSTEVRVALIKSLKKMAEIPESQLLLWAKFNVFLPESLANKNATVRSQAVEAFVQLRAANALPVFLNTTHNMLNDPDSSVRFAVINAIKAFGDKDHLDLLRQRRLEELKTENFDVASLLEGAMEAILNSLSIESTYNWSVGLIDTDEDEKVLYQQASGLLWKKIVQADTDSVKVALAHRILALEGQARTSQANKLYRDAVKWYRMLLALDLPATQRMGYQKAVLDLVLTNDNAEVLTAAGPIITPQLERSADTLGQVAAMYDTFDLKNDLQLSRSVTIVMTLIVPLKSYPNDNLRKAWQKRRAGLALAILERQVKLLREKGQVTKENITIMTTLVPELAAYPYEKDVDQRKAALETYRAVLLEYFVDNAKPEKLKSTTVTKKTASSESK